MSFVYEPFYEGQEVEVRLPADWFPATVRRYVGGGRYEVYVDEFATHYVVHEEQLRR